MILVDTVAGLDNGKWLLWALDEYPESHVIAYCGDLAKYTKLSEAMRISMRAPKRFGLRCAYIGQHGYFGFASKSHEETTEHPLILPPFAGIRVQNLAHMDEVAQAYREKAPISFALWIYDRNNQKSNFEIKNDEPPQPTIQ